MFSFTLQGALGELLAPRPHSKDEFSSLIKSGQFDESLKLLRNDSVTWIDDRDKLGLCPLHIASAAGALEVVVELLSQGANINALSGNGKSPLHYAACNNRKSVVHVLLRSGCDPTIPDENGLIAAEITSSDCIRELLLRESAFEKSFAAHESINLQNDQSIYIQSTKLGLTELERSDITSANIYFNDPSSSNYETYFSEECGVSKRDIKEFNSFAFSTRGQIQEPTHIQSNYQNEISISPSESSSGGSGSLNEFDYENYVSHNSSQNLEDQEQEFTEVAFNKSSHERNSFDTIEKSKELNLESDSDFTRDCNGEQLLSCANGTLTSIPSNFELVDGYHSMEKSFVSSSLRYRMTPSLETSGFISPHSFDSAHFGNTDVYSSHGCATSNNIYNEVLIAAQAACKTTVIHNRERMIRLLLLYICVFKSPYMLIKQNEVISNFDLLKFAEMLLIQWSDLSETRFVDEDVETFNQLDNYSSDENAKIESVLLLPGKIEGFSILHLSACCGNIDMMKIATNYGNRAWSRDIRGRTPLHVVIEWYMKRNSTSFEHSQFSFEEVVTQLRSMMYQENGIDPVGINAPIDLAGFTPVGIIGSMFSKSSPLCDRELAKLSRLTVSTDSHSTMFVQQSSFLSSICVTGDRSILPATPQNFTCQHVKFNGNDTIACNSSALNSLSGENFVLPLWTSNNVVGSNVSSTFSKNSLSGFHAIYALNTAKGWASEAREATVACSPLIFIPSWSFYSICRCYGGSGCMLKVIESLPHIINQEIEAHYRKLSKYGIDKFNHLNDDSIEGLKVLWSMINLRIEELVLSQKQFNILKIKIQNKPKTENFSAFHKITDALCVPTFGVSEYESERAQNASRPAYTPQLMCLDDSACIMISVLVTNDYVTVCSVGNKFFNDESIVCTIGRRKKPYSNPKISTITTPFSPVSTSHSSLCESPYVWNSFQFLNTREYGYCDEDSGSALCSIMDTIILDENCPDLIHYSHSSFENKNLGFGCHLSKYYDNYNTFSESVSESESNLPICEFDLSHASALELSQKATKPSESNLTVRPVISFYRRNVNDEFMILAGAGVTSIMSPKEIVNFFEKRLGYTIYGGPVGGVTKHDVAKACESFQYHCLNHGLVENITIGLVMLATPNGASYPASPRTKSNKSNLSVFESSSQTASSSTPHQPYRQDKNSDDLSSYDSHATKSTYFHDIRNVAYTDVPSSEKRIPAARGLFVEIPTSSFDKVAKNLSLELSSRPGSVRKPSTPGHVTMQAYANVSDLGNYAASSMRNH